MHAYSWGELSTQTAYIAHHRLGSVEEKFIVIQTQHIVAMSIFEASLFNTKYNTIKKQEPKYGFCQTYKH